MNIKVDFPREPHHVRRASRYHLWTSSIDTWHRIKFVACCRNVVAGSTSASASTAVELKTALFCTIRQCCWISSVGGILEIEPLTVGKNLGNIRVKHIIIVCVHKTEVSLPPVSAPTSTWCWCCRHSSTNTKKFARITKVASNKHCYFVGRMQNLLYIPMFCVEIIISYRKF